jgi:hypothetical protein
MKEKTMMVRLMARVVLAAGCKPDPDGAALALCKAGFAVAMMPAELRDRLDDPDDYFLEATKVVPDAEQAMSAMMDEVDELVRPYGGGLDDVGPVDNDHIPFAWLAA